MRKLFSLFVAFVATTTLWAEDFSVDGIYYNYLEDNNVEVTYRGDYYQSYNDEYSGEVTIPSTVTYNGTTYSVTSIGDDAFAGCSSLTSITIPNSVKSIGSLAFENCSSLTSVTIPNSITSIGYGAFADCSSLTSVTIPNSVTSIEDYTFAGCSSLTSITIPNSVKSIGNYAFSRTGIYNDNSNWENDVLYIDNCLIDAKEQISGSYTIKENTRLIATWAFYGCSSLTSVTIPNSVTSIGERAFYDCSSLVSVTMLPTTPPTINTIFNPLYAKSTLINIPDNTLSAYQTAWGNEYAFVNNENTLTLHVATPGTLEDLILDAGTRPALVAKLILTGTLNNADFTCMHRTMTSLVDVDLSGITNINGLNFNAKSKLVKIILPANLTSIGERAFENCSSLKSITIPNSVKWIGEKAFMNCSSLKSVTIGNSVISIGAWTFYNCESLTKTNYTGDIAGWCNIKFADASSNPMYYSHNFYINDQEIYDLVIPNTVGSIHNSAFINCSSLDSVTIPNSVTSIGGGAFYNCEFLRTVICEAVEVPELGSDVFSNTPITEATLYVPEQSLDDYKAAYQWKDFGRILPLEEAPSAVENTRLPIANGAKLLRNGQVYILKDNKVYTLMGQEIQ